MLYIEYRYEQKMSAQTLERQMLDPEVDRIEFALRETPEPS
jgi:hypothetical protein